jgi:DNA polymerase-3 subunit beta
MVEDGEGIVSVALHEGSVFIRREMVVEKEQEGANSVLAVFTLVSKLIESEFPPYDQVIPASHDREVVVGRGPFLEALRRVSIVSSDRTLGVKFVLSEGSLEIVTNNPSVGEGSEQLDASYDGEDLEIGFNARYFIDILSVLDDEEISLELSGALDPVIVKDPTGTFVGVVMPMRV